MKHYITFDADTLLITASVTMPQSSPEEEEGLIETLSPVDPNLYYVNESLEAVLREQMGITIDKVEITADGADTATITGIPAGANVLLDDVSQGTIPDGTLEITSDAPKTINLEFVLFPYLSKKVVIHAA